MIYFPFRCTYIPSHRVTHHSFFPLAWYFCSLRYTQSRGHGCAFLILPSVAQSHPATCIFVRQPRQRRYSLDSCSSIISCPGANSNNSHCGLSHRFHSLVSRPNSMLMPRARHLIRTLFAVSVYQSKVELRCVQDLLVRGQLLHINSWTTSQNTYLDILSLPQP